MFSFGGNSLSQNRLKIGIFVDAFFPMVDGVTVVVNMYATQMQQIADVTVFAPQSRDKTYVDNFPYKVVRSKKMMIPLTDYDYSTPLFDRHFRKSLRQSKLDIVHIHSPFSIGKMGVDYAKKHQIPCIATLHSQYKMDFQQRSKSEKIADMMVKEIMKVFNRVNEAYAVNHKVAQIFQSYGATFQPLVRHNGTDLLPLPQDNSLQQLRKKHQVLPHEKVFLFVGRIDVIKNILFIIDSLSHVKKSKIAFKMFFIGKGPDEEKLKEKIHAAKLENQVFMLGKIIDRTELARYYQMADLFIFPSLYDASSLVQIEAASQKTPALFLEGAATADTVTPEVNGFLAYHDPILYARKIVSICENPEKLKEVSENAFRDLYKPWKEIIEDTLATYERLISTHRHI